MAQKITFEQKLKGIFLSKGHDREKLAVTPYRDWRFVVIAFFIAIIGSLGLNAYLFMGVNEEDFFGASFKKAEVLNFNKEKLSAVLRTFEEKETAFEALKKSAIVLVDPSL